MEQRFHFMKFSFTIVYILIISNILVLHEARLFFDDQRLEREEALESSLTPLEATEGQPYGLPSPLALPPLKSPSPLQDPPFTPPSRMSSPPLSPTNFPINSPPPSGPFSPPMYTPLPSPPQYAFVPPNSTVAAAPPQHKKPQFAVWCVAKSTVPDTMIQAALDYACGSGADCKPIQPNGRCFQPNTLVAHASYAFNSYWQTTKAAGGTCDFGGTAMLVTSDPSSNNCSFIFK